MGAFQWQAGATLGRKADLLLLDLSIVLDVVQQHLTHVPELGSPCCLARSPDLPGQFPDAHKGTHATRSVRAVA